MRSDSEASPSSPGLGSSSDVEQPRLAFAVLAGVAIVSMLAGVALASLVRSPAQELADAQPPTLSVITAEVLERDLKAEVITRGVVAMGRTVRVGPVTSSAALSIVSKVGVEPGDHVRAGELLIEVSGRPVFLLQGAFPAYRDLAVGDEGPDAAAVNDALKKLQLPNAAGTEFTSATSEGLAAVYRAAGYEPPVGGGLDLREIVFAPAPQATVLAVNAQLGESSEKEELVVLASGETSVTAQVPPGQISSIEVGNNATIHLVDGTVIQATVESVSPGATLEATEVVLRPEDELPTVLNGNDVRIVITQRSSSRSALTVPVPAIFARADGSTVVVRTNEKGGQDVVAVTVGEMVGGFAAVTPAEGVSQLREGDEVIVSGPGLDD